MELHADDWSSLSRGYLQIFAFQKLLCLAQQLILVLHKWIQCEMLMSAYIILVGQRQFAGKSCSHHAVGYAISLTHFSPHTVIFLWNHDEAVDVVVHPDAITKSISRAMCGLRSLDTGRWLERLTSRNRLVSRDVENPVESILFMHRCHSISLYI